MVDMANENLEGSKMHVELDVGNLCILTAARLKSSIDSNPSEDFLKALAADGAQLLIAELIKLPSEFHEHIPVAKLPKPTTSIPREKPLPIDKPQTRWEKFAKTKGIARRKKDKLVWDEESKDWKCQYGYRGKNNKKEWLIEVPNNADPNIDLFAKKAEDKKERIAKNEYQRLRNIAVSRNKKVTNLESVDKADKHQLSRSLVAAKAATASVGRFTDKLSKERQPKDSLKRRKFQPNIPSDMKNEKENALKILDNMNVKKPMLDVEGGVQLFLIKGHPKRPKAVGKTGKSAAYGKILKRQRSYKISRKLKGKK